MKDERIQTTANRFAAKGFCVWLVLMSISLCYRTLILKQHPREWWNIFAIWIIGVFFVFITYAKKGVLDHDFKRRWLTITIAASIGAVITFLPTWQSVAGQMPSVVHVGLFLIGFLLAIQRRSLASL